jgi:hypothetical protein
VIGSGAGQKPRGGLVGPVVADQCPQDVGAAGQGHDGLMCFLPRLACDRRGAGTRDRWRC